MNDDRLLLAGCAIVAACGWVYARLVLLTDRRLLGTWQSDGERTVRTWQGHRPLTDEQAAALWKVFGHMRITWWRCTYAVEMDGRIAIHRYRSWPPTTSPWSPGCSTHWRAGGPIRKFFRRITLDPG